MTTDYSTKRILGPTYGTDYCNGVGTPFIANHPYTDKNYFIFTGWTSYEGANREIFVADIKEDKTLSNIRKILPWDYPGDLTQGGHTTSHAAWDEHHKCWLVTSAEMETSSPMMLPGIYRFSDDFSELLGYTRIRPPHESSPGPSGQTLPGSDGGWALLRPTFEKGTEGVFFYPTYQPTGEAERIAPTIEKLAIMHTPDYTADQITIDYSDYVNWGGHPAALQPIQTTAETIVILVEDMFHQNPWTVKPIFLCGSGHYPACTEMYGVQAYGSVIPHPATGAYHVGHPFATIHPDGKYYNFFHASHRECTPSFRHEIWCTTIPPSRLDPRSYDAFFSRLYEGLVSEDGYVSKIIPGWFARRLSVLVETDVHGTLTVLGGTKFNQVDTDVDVRQLSEPRSVSHFSHVFPYFKIAFKPDRPTKRFHIEIAMKRP